MGNRQSAQSISSSARPLRSKEPAQRSVDENVVPTSHGSSHPTTPPIIESQSAAGKSQSSDQLAVELRLEKGKGKATSPTGSRADTSETPSRPKSNSPHPSQRQVRTLSSIPRQLQLQTERKSRRRSLFKSFPFSSSSSSSNTAQGEMSKLDALRVYATVKQPSAQIPPNVLLTHDDQSLAIFDAFPKAKYHFLILPRYPFYHHSDKSKAFKSICKLETLDDLKSLMLKAGDETREEIFNGMRAMAREVEEMIKDEMMKTEGFTWGVDIGFHAIPSMKISDCLKTKKHYNSFRPDLGFFIPIMEVERWIANDNNYVKERVEGLSTAKTLLDHPLECFRCDELFSNMPKLKKHLEAEFDKAKTEGRKRMKERGHQRDSDEDLF